MAKLERHLFLKVDNEPGKLAEITGRMSESDINLNCLIAFDEGDQGTLILGTSDNERAKEFLRDSVRAMHEMPIVVVTVPDRVGAFHDIVRKVAEAGITIEWAVATTTGGDAAIAMLTSDNARAAELV